MLEIFCKELWYWMDQLLRPVTNRKLYLYYMLMSKFNVPCHILRAAQFNKFHWWDNWRSLHWYIPCQASKDAMPSFKKQEKEKKLMIDLWICWTNEHSVRTGNSDKEYELVLVLVHESSNTAEILCVSSSSFSRSVSMSEYRCPGHRLQQLSWFRFPFVKVRYW